MPTTTKKIEGNLGRIHERVAEACARVGRSPREVAIVAVTKAADLDAVKNAIDAGLTELGENRARQLADRAAEIDAYLRRRRTPPPAPVRWHMVGHLQRNKVKAVLPVVSVIHSVDSLRLAEEIDARAERDGRRVDVMLQVNCAEESQKFGCRVGAATHLAEMLCTLKHLRLTGLMAMAPLVEDAEAARPTFARLRELYEEMRNEKIGGGDFRHLSMGMSQDYWVAVEEGATMLRIGTALFE
jgi:hypothetical protein